MRRGLVAFASLVTSAGCDSLADGDYVGEPMFELDATLVTTSKEPTPASGIALAWQDPGGAGGPGVAMTIVPVQTELPATVKIVVPLPPPLAARFAFDDADVELAEAFVLLVDDGTPRPMSHGIVRDRVVVFATGDVAAGTQAAEYLGGPVRAGYHLRKLVNATPGTAQQVMIDRCVASGAAPRACETRRSYQLVPVEDAAPVRIVVTP
jgi:hypothetical protein